jgi:hypothetical protein
MSNKKFGSVEFSGHLGLNALALIPTSTVLAAEVKKTHALLMALSVHLQNVSIAVGVNSVGFSKMATILGAEIGFI